MFPGGDKFDLDLLGHGSGGAYVSYVFKGGSVCESHHEVDLLLDGQTGFVILDLEAGGKEHIES